MVNLLPTRTTLNQFAALAVCVATRVPVPLLADQNNSHFFFKKKKQANTASSRLDEIERANESARSHL